MKPSPPHPASDLPIRFGIAARIALLVCGTATAATAAIGYRRGAFADRPDEDPAVVFLDLKMPTVDGLEVVRALKSDPKTRHIPIAMPTSSREEADLTAGYGRGVNAYVVKPLGTDEFLDGIRQIGLFWGSLNEPPRRPAPPPPADRPDPPPEERDAP